MQIHLAKSDITTMNVDAVVNPANSLGIMGGGVAAALSRKGGPTIQREAMSLAPISAGADGGAPPRRGGMGGGAADGWGGGPTRGVGRGLGGVDPADAARAMVDE